MRPYFPPVDQMQSINLRNALLRALENAKKTGVLGRDCVIRKTMLDDCRGERLEEVLSHFSTAVLKKVVEGDMRSASAHPPISLCLALQSKHNEHGDLELKTLILAHKVSLRRLLAQKRDMKYKFRSYCDLLNVAECAISRRTEAVRAKEADSKRDTLSNSTRIELRRGVSMDWSGNANWMDTLLRGDSEVQGSGLFAMSFSDIWQHVQQGSLAEIDNGTPGLLGQLEERVKSQNDALAKWDAFRKETFGHASEKHHSSVQNQPDQGSRQKSIDFGFRAHADLQVEKMAKSHDVGLRGPPKLAQEHAEVIERLSNRLSTTRDSKSNFDRFIERLDAQSRHLAGVGKKPVLSTQSVADVSDVEDDLYEPEPAHIPVRTNRARLETLRRRSVKSEIVESETFHQFPAKKPSPAPPRRDDEDSIPRKRADLDLLPVEASIKVEPQPSASQAVAEGIISAMYLATPTPDKRPKKRPVLSLAQRARLSMAGRQSTFLDDEPDLPVPSTTKPIQHDATSTALTESDGIKSNPSDVDSMDLSSRTRLSMVGLEQAQKKAQLKRRRSLRQSSVPPRKEGVGGHFPTVEEQPSQDHHSGLAEELMLEEDMEAVFKSRPKMRTSPLGSPTKH